MLWVFSMIVLIRQWIASDLCVIATDLCVCSRFAHSKRLFVLQWTTSNWLGKEQNISPTWKIFMKDVDLGEPTSFLDHVYLVCTQRDCQVSKDIVENYRSVFESRISTRATEKLTETKATGKPDAGTISS